MGVRYTKSLESLASNQGWFCFVKLLLTKHLTDAVPSTLLGDAEQQVDMQN